jgi:hypothetical protein
MKAPVSKNDGTTILAEGSHSLHYRQGPSIWELKHVPTEPTRTTLLAPHLSFCSQWSVPCHEEVAPGGGDKRGDQTNQVVVHVPGVPESGGAARRGRRRACLMLMFVKSRYQGVVCKLGTTATGLAKKRF